VFAGLSYKKSRDVSARRRRAQEKGKIPWTYVIPAIIILVVIVGALYVSAKLGQSSTESNLPPLGDQNFSVLGAKFACLGTESLVYHVHPWLRIWIEGKNVTIPAAIGMKGAFQATTVNGIPTYGASTCYEPLHTHDDTGIIHIESESDTNYTLGDFFNVWFHSYANEPFNGTNHPIVFNNTDILGYTVDSTHKLLLLVDGQPEPSSFTFTSLVLDTLDYCSAQNSAATTSPCYPTAGGNPSWNGVQGDYPYGTGHTIVIEYETT
jgi:hypothetical protein